jgi:hypothetical protein
MLSFVNCLCARRRNQCAENDGRTALTEALRGGHPEIAEYLRSRGGTDATIPP